MFQFLFWLLEAGFRIVFWFFKLAMINIQKSDAVEAKQLFGEIYK